MTYPEKYRKNKSNMSMIKNSKLNIIKNVKNWTWWWQEKFKELNNELKSPELGWINEYVAFKPIH